MGINRTKIAPFMSLSCFVFEGVLFSCLILFCFYWNWGNWGELGNGFEERSVLLGESGNGCEERMDFWMKRKWGERI